MLIKTINITPKRVMKTIYDQINLIAHRGFCNGDYENTFPAFLNACKKPFWGVETDIQFTSDGHIVCFHDKTIHRLMGEKTKVGDLRYRELNKKSFSHKNYSSIKAHICTFSTYLKVCRKYRKQCIIEIKTKLNERQIKIILNTINHYKYNHYCSIISFNQGVLRKVRELDNNIKLQLLIKNPIRPFISFCKKNNVDASLLSRIITKELIVKLNNNNIKTGAWTVNNKQTAQTLINIGVTYITTDRLM